MFGKFRSPTRAPSGTPFTSDKHRQRVKLLLLFGSGIIMLMGSGWGAYYFSAGKWPLVALDVVLGAVGVLTLYWTLTDRTTRAAVVAMHALLVIVSTYCLLDVPTAGVPRSSHMHLLSVGAAGFLLFRGSGLYLRVVLPAVCFVACLIFASTAVGIGDPGYLLPAEAREAGVWVNNATCVASMALVLYIMQADVTLRNAIEDDMRIALAEGHFQLHYQPQVLADGRVTGAEALLRWQHPQRGLIPPGKFITLAEETGLIVPIGDWVLRQACCQLAIWGRQPDTAHLTLSVNVSACQFRQPDFVSQVLDIVRRTGASPSNLKLELTESALVKDIDDVVEKMVLLRGEGIALSIDDFGTGYSSLSYIKRLPLDQLKIDQSFVRDLLADPHDMAIVRTLIALGKSLDLMLVAEGVETTEQLSWLQDNDCKVYQGYLFSKPLPIDQFEAQLERAAPRAAARQHEPKKDAPSSEPTLT